MPPLVLSSRCACRDGTHLQCSGLLLLLSITTLMSLSTLSTIVAQTNQRVWGMATTDVNEQRYGQLNGVVDFFPLRNLSISARGAQREYQIQEGAFEVQMDGFLLGAELKYFPFGPPRNYDFNTLKNRGIRTYFNWDDTFFERYFRGAFVGFGFEYRSIHSTLTPDPKLGSPIAVFPFKTLDNGPTLQLGYGASINHLYLGVGYRLKFGNAHTTSEVPNINITDTQQQSLTKNALGNAALQLNVGFSF